MIVPVGTVTAESPTTATESPTVIRLAIGLALSLILAIVLCILCVVVCCICMCVVYAKV